MNATGKDSWLLVVSVIAAILSIENRSERKESPVAPILIPGLAKPVEIRRQTGITTITVVPKTSAGSAIVVTLEDTSRSMGPGGADLPFAAINYVPKAPRRERDAGLEGLPLQAEPIAMSGRPINQPDRLCSDGLIRSGIRQAVRCVHPCVKPVRLLRLLVRLACPPGGHVLDPFVGSGSTGVACRAEGRDCTGIDTEAEYLELARYRAADGYGDEDGTEAAREDRPEPAPRRLAQMSLF